MKNAKKFHYERQRLNLRISGRLKKQLLSYANKSDTTLNDIAVQILKRSLSLADRSAIKA